MNDVMRFLSALVTGNDKYLSDAYGREWTNEYIASHPHEPPEVMNCHDGSQMVFNANQRTATEHLQDSVIAGDRSVIASRIAPRTYLIHAEDWNQHAYQAMIDHERGCI